jgi:hypothetical protein
MNRPLVPEDIKRARPATFLYRAGAAHVRAHLTRSTAEREAKALFGSNTVTDMVLKAASSPATTTNVGWAGALAQQSIDDSIAAITSVSAAAGLIRRGERLTFDSTASIRVPGHLLDSSDAGSWVGEGQPARVRAQRYSAGITLAPRKVLVITSFTAEMVKSSNIEAISKSLISEATA